MPNLEAKHVCDVCGSSPCYGICPRNDPFGGDQQRENEDYEFNAEYDYRREAFGGECFDSPEDYAEYDQTPEQTAALDAWLAEMEAKNSAPYVPAEIPF